MLEAFSPWGSTAVRLVFAQIEALCAKYEVSIKDSISQLPDDLLTEIVEGSEEDLVLLDDRFTELRGVPPLL